MCRHLIVLLLLCCSKSLGTALLSLVKCSCLQSLDVFAKKNKVKYVI